MPGAALCRALSTLVRRHEPLRTVLLPGRDTLLQRVEPAREVELPVEPLLPDANDRQERLRLEPDRPFDPRADPCLRGLLLHGGSGAQAVHVRLLVMHDGAFDGWSRMVLFRELGVPYGWLEEALAPQLPPHALAVMPCATRPGAALPPPETPSSSSSCSFC